MKQNWTANENRNPFPLFKENIRRVKTALSKWSEETCGGNFKQLVIREDIVKIKEKLFEEFSNTKNRALLQKAHEEHQKYLHFKEYFWRQKAGFDLFKMGQKDKTNFITL